MKLDPWLVRGIVILILAVWISVTIIAYLVPSVRVPTGINQLLMLLAGGALAQSGAAKGRRRGDQK